MKDQEQLGIVGMRDVTNGCRCETNKGLRKTDLRYHDEGEGQLVKNSEGGWGTFSSPFNTPQGKCWWLLRRGGGLEEGGNRPRQDFAARGRAEGALGVPWGFLACLCFPGHLFRLPS